MFEFFLKVPRQVFAGSEVRVPQLSHKTFRHEQACGGSEVWGGRDRTGQEDEYDEEVICGQCDRAPCKGCCRPPECRHKERSMSTVTHMLQKSWCEVCIKARGREDAHASHMEKGAKPTIAMDYKEFGEAEDSEDKIKTIILEG